MQNLATRSDTVPTLRSKVPAPHLVLIVAHGPFQTETANSDFLAIAPREKDATLQQYIIRDSDEIEAANINRLVFSTAPVRKKQSLLKTISEISATIPAEELESIPTDLSKRKNYYLYGTKD
jgi:hypothetical protein